MTGHRKLWYGTVVQGLADPASSCRGAHGTPGECDRPYSGPQKQYRECMHFSRGLHGLSFPGSSLKTSRLQHQRIFPREQQQSLNLPSTSQRGRRFVFRCGIIQVGRLRESRYDYYSFGASGARDPIPRCIRECAQAKRHAPTFAAPVPTFATPRSIPAEQ